MWHHNIKDFFKQYNVIIKNYNIKIKENVPQNYGSSYNIRVYINNNMIQEGNRYVITIDLHDSLISVLIKQYLLNNF